MSDNGDICNRLFDPDRKQRRELWSFIKLVAPSIEEKKWKSKDAVKAYCLKCSNTINYTPGTSNQILRHMQRYHSDDLYSSHSGKDKKRSLQRQTIQESTTKKLKPVNESVARKGHSILLKWITESYSPLSIVEDPGLLEYTTFWNGLKEEYTIPSRCTITELLCDTFHRTVVTIKAMIESECEYYSLTSNIWLPGTAQAYISLVIHYLTEDFVMKVVTLRCAPFSTVRPTDSEMTNITKESLENVNLHLDKLVIHVSSNDASKAAGDLNVYHQECVAHSFDSIVSKVIQWKIEESNQQSIDIDGSTCERLKKNSGAITTLQEYVKYFSNNTIESPLWLRKSIEYSHDTLPEKIPSDITTQWNSTVHMLKAALDSRLHLDRFFSHIQTKEGRAKFLNCSNILEITDEQWFILENVYNILNPFVQATEALCAGETYATWPLTLSVLKMIENHLIRYTVTQGVSGAPWLKDAIETLNIFRKEILKEFESRFKRIQIDLLWTILLDPRLTAMNGFSSVKRLVAKKMLIDQMRSAPIQLRNQNEKRRGGGDDSDDAGAGSLWGNTLLDNVFAAPGIGDGTEDQTVEQGTKQAQPAEIELEEYLSLCRQLRVSGPLEFWKTNGSTFPVLSWLSRKWMCAVSTCLSPECLFSRTGTTITARRAKLNDDNVGMLTYIHDNLQYAF